jgi:type VI protein secretion system component VasK
VKWVPWSIALALLTGCVTAPGEEPPPRYVLLDRRSDADRLLLYFARVKDLPASELSKEQRATEQAFSLSKSDYARMQLAFLTSLPYAAFKDYARALALLEPLTRERNSSELRPLALFLASQIAEKKALEDSAESLSQRLKEGDKRIEPLESKMKEEQKRIEALEVRLREEQKRTLSLEKKLEALKAIEKSISDREQTPPGK